MLLRRSSARILTVICYREVAQRTSSLQRRSMDLTSRNHCCAASRTNAPQPEDQNNAAWAGLRPVCVSAKPNESGVSKDSASHPSPLHPEVGLPLNVSMIAE